MTTLAQQLFHLACRKDATRPPETEYDEDYFRHGLEETALFFHRLGDQLDFAGKKVLDVGCGHGATCIYVARHGASRVVGIDIQEHFLDFARAKLRAEYPGLAHKVDFKLGEDLKQLGGEKFDVILSKDSFEHIANTGAYLQILQEHVADDGVIAIGFGPLWKSPYGGHIGFMTPLPWAHLLFPERVIMKERRRFRPDETANTFDEVKGGLNKMTLSKFMGIVKRSNLEPIYFKTNVHDRKLTGLFNILRHIPFCREYFTFNLYSIWRVKAQNMGDFPSSSESAVKTSRAAPLTLQEK